MGRLSIEIPEELHKQIKALAAWNGLSLKDYIIERTIPEEIRFSEESSIIEFLNFLAPRIKEAEQGKLSKISVKEIVAKAKSQRKN